jgi:hypothetical protein
MSMISQTRTARIVPYSPSRLEDACLRAGPLGTLRLGSPLEPNDGGERDSVRWHGASRKPNNVIRECLVIAFDKAQSSHS